MDSTELAELNQNFHFTALITLPCFTRKFNNNSQIIILQLCKSFTRKFNNNSQIWVWGEGEVQILFKEVRSSKAKVHVFCLLSHIGVLIIYRTTKRNRAYFATNLNFYICIKGNLL